MKKVLRGAGLNPDNFDYAQAKQLVPQILNRYRNNLCTLNQVKKLKEFGIDATQFTFPEASSAFDYLKTVNWRRHGHENFKPKPKIKMPTRQMAEQPF